MKKIVHSPNFKEVDSTINPFGITEKGAIVGGCTSANNGTPPISGVEAGSFQASSGVGENPTGQKIFDFCKENSIPPSRARELGFSFCNFVTPEIALRLRQLEPEPFIETIYLADGVADLRLIGLFAIINKRCTQKELDEFLEFHVADPFKLQPAEFFACLPKTTKWKDCKQMALENQNND